MKKIIAIVLVVVLVAGGLGGFACARATEYEPMPEQKLVGMGFYGTEPFADGTLVFRPMFVFTNPNSDSEITIDRIAFPPGMPMLPDLTGPLNAITIEIFWSSTEEDSLPLTGWQYSGCLRFDAEGNMIDLGTMLETHMSNME